MKVENVATFEDLIVMLEVEEMPPPLANVNTPATDAKAEETLRRKMKMLR
ncbi:hypothetical protein Fmac_014141 [Flemingia macrophylla]|uniref:Uncharacterized protein n=1 Tax=Flemingia macrophylla TaxID=520843 RepID=A0ABD1MBM6_9FABA